MKLQPHTGYKIIIISNSVISGVSAFQVYDYLFTVCMFSVISCFNSIYSVAKMKELNSVLLSYYCYYKNKLY